MSPLEFLLDALITLACAAVLLALIWAPIILAILAHPLHAAWAVPVGIGLSAIVPGSFLMSWAQEKLRGQ